MMFPFEYQWWLTAPAVVASAWCDALGGRPLGDVRRFAGPAPGV